MADMRPWACSFSESQLPFPLALMKMAARDSQLSDKSRCVSSTLLLLCRTGGHLQAQVFLLDKSPVGSLMNFSSRWSYQRTSQLTAKPPHIDAELLKLAIHLVLQSTAYHSQVGARTKAWAAFRSSSISHRMANVAIFPVLIQGRMTCYRRYRCHQEGTGEVHSFKAVKSLFFFFSGRGFYLWTLHWQSRSSTA
jgi:hypothetical protein